MNNRGEMPSFVTHDTTFEILAKKENIKIIKSPSQYQLFIEEKRWVVYKLISHIVDKKIGCIYVKKDNPVNYKVYATDGKHYRRVARFAQSIFETIKNAKTEFVQDCIPVPVLVPQQPQQDINLWVRED